MMAYFEAIFLYLPRTEKRTQYISGWPISGGENETQYLLNINLEC
jgi:hypothetical protein